MTCEYCGKSVGLLRRLKGQPFCSDAHAKAHKQDQEQVFLMSLLKPTILGGGTADSAPTEENPPRRTPAVPAHEDDLASLANALLHETFSGSTAVPAPERTQFTRPLALQPVSRPQESNPEFNPPPVCPFLIEPPREQARAHRWPPKEATHPVPYLGAIAFPEGLCKPTICGPLADIGIFTVRPTEADAIDASGTELAPLVPLERPSPCPAMVRRSQTDWLRPKCSSRVELRHLATDGLISRLSVTE